MAALEGIGGETVCSPPFLEFLLALLGDLDILPVGRDLVALFGEGL